MFQYHDQLFIIMKTLILIFLSEKQEEIVLQLLEQQGTVPSEYYNYYEQFSEKNGEKIVRLSIIDAINDLVINEVTMHQENFDKDLVKGIFRNFF